MMYGMRINAYLCVMFFLMFWRFKYTSMLQIDCLMLLYHCTLEPV